MWQKNKKKKVPTKEAALSKMEYYCAYQERCHSEVLEKLGKLGIWGEWANDIIQKLIDDNFLSEERFACSYVRSKFRYKKWGRIKIKRKLKEKRVSAGLIDLGLKEIEESEYWNTLLDLIEKKQIRLKIENSLKSKQKMVNYLLQKGYESSLIWKGINETMND